MNKIKLPPLPEPTYRSPSGTGNYFDGYTKQTLQDYACTAIEADRQARGEPVYLYRRKGLGEFAECSRERYDELSAKPYHFQTKVLYTAPQPSSEGVCKNHPQQIQKCWKGAVDHELVTLGSTADSYASPKEAIQALIDWHVSVVIDPLVNGGYKLAPIEPTDEMIEAGCALYDSSLRQRYRAMLEVAPEVKT